MESAFLPKFRSADPLMLLSGDARGGLSGLDSPEPQMLVSGEARPGVVGAGRGSWELVETGLIWRGSDPGSLLPNARSCFYPTRRVDSADFFEFHLVLAQHSDAAF